MQTIRDNYFTAYRSLKLTRDAKGVLVVEFHSNGGPCTFSALHHTEALSRAQELAEIYLQAPEVTRRDTRIHFIQPLKERIVREVGYGLSLEGASSAALIKSKQAKSEPAVQKIKSA